MWVNHGFFARAKNTYHHFQSTGQSCLWFQICICYQICKLVRRKNVRDYDIAIFISYTISTLGWYGCDRLIWGMIWELPYNSIYFYMQWYIIIWAASRRSFQIVHLCSKIHSSAYSMCQWTAKAFILGCIRWSDSLLNLCYISMLGIFPRFIIFLIFLRKYGLTFYVNCLHYQTICIKCQSLCLHHVNIPI